MITFWFIHACNIPWSFGFNTSSTYRHLFELLFTTVSQYFQLKNQNGIDLKGAIETGIRYLPTASGRVKRAVRRAEGDIFSCEDMCIDIRLLHEQTQWAATLYIPSVFWKQVAGQRSWTARPHKRELRDTLLEGKHHVHAALSAVRCHVHSGVHRPSAHRLWRASTLDRTLCTHPNSPAQRATSQFASGYSQCSKPLCADGCKRIMASSAERARALESLSYLWRRYILSDSYAGCAPC